MCHVFSLTINRRADILVRSNLCHGGATGNWGIAADKNVRVPSRRKVQGFNARNSISGNSFHEPHSGTGVSPVRIETNRRDACATTSPAVHGPNARPKLDVEASHEPERGLPQAAARRHVENSYELRSWSEFGRAASWDNSRSGSWARRKARFSMRCLFF